jgi:hypothetical protein
MGDLYKAFDNRPRDTRPLEVKLDEVAKEVGAATADLCSAVKLHAEKRDLLDAARGAESCARTAVDKAKERLGTAQAELAALAKGER